MVRNQPSGSANGWLVYYAGRSPFGPRTGITDHTGVSPATWWVYTDHLERPVLMTDATSAIVWRASYLPFGEAASITGTATLNQRFPGQWFQLESGLAYNWHRHYDATTGRYLQPDPLGMPDGPNRWAYVGNSPLMWTDPTGEYVPWKEAVFPWYLPYRILTTARPDTPLFCPAPPAGEFPTDAIGPMSTPVPVVPGPILNSDDAARPPAGSRPIDETPWSGNHEEIKRGVGAGPRDNTRISPDGEVWVQNPDDSWTNYGPAGDYSGSGKARGRRGKDRRYKR